MVFSKQTYVLVVIALSVLVLGFLFMGGPVNDDPGKFDETLFSFKRITLAPLLIVASYASLIYVILRKPTIECSNEKKKQ